MSHKSGHIIIKSVAPPDSGDVVQSSTVELNFAPGTPLEDRVKKFRQASKLLEKLEHDEDHED